MHTPKKTKKPSNFGDNDQKNFFIRVPVIPTIDVVVFPQSIVPLLIVDTKIIEGVQLAINKGDKQIVIVACKKQSISLATTIGPKDLFSIGTLATIVRIADLKDGTTKLLVQGVQRVKIESIQFNQILEAEVSSYPFILSSDEASVENRIKQIKLLVEEAAVLGGSLINNEFAMLLSRMSSTEKIIDFILSRLTLSIQDLQKLLEIETYNDFFTLLEEYIVRERDVAEIHQKIKHKARESMNISQKEMYVREQIRALKEEIGDDMQGEFDQLHEKFLLIDQYLSDEAREEVQRCLNRLETMSMENSESILLKNYLECVFDLPWGNETKDNDDFENAKKILDENHYGLQNVKERILDFLSVKFLSKNNPATILCFYGPPGVGKTSLSYAIAKALGRSVFRVSVGGMRDEAEIRGHRRTYVGAIPGRFIKGLRQAKSSNPLIIIDEIDKIGQDFKGDPAAALLELLDPGQNHSFHDYYLGFSFDFSKSFFIATANNIDSIPLALRDRLELIELPSYTFEEKRFIAKGHLTPRIIFESGLENRNIFVDNNIIDSIIHGYTYEAGVRDLERWLRKLYSRIARFIVEKKVEIKIDDSNLEEIIGVPRYVDTCEKKLKNLIGLVHGLCWTPCGGDMLNIETVTTKGKGSLILTGHLGDVMKESAQAAFTFIKTNRELLNVDHILFDQIDVHMHVPAGAIAKDGPSAGCTIVVSMLSALTKQEVWGDLAMTGEIGLLGDILPVGGIKEKVLAAKKHGIKRVIIPSKNKHDVGEVKEIIGDIEVIYVKTIGEVLNLAFVEKLNIREDDSIFEKNTVLVEEIIGGNIQIS